MFWPLVKSRIKIYIKNFIKTISPTLFAYIKGLTLLFDRDSYLVQTGFINTHKVGLPCKPDGKPLPWMNYSVITFFDGHLEKNINLFEFGSGYSTLFFAERVEHVIAVEYDREWFTKIKCIAPQNVTIIFCEKDYDGIYCHTIKEMNKLFDMIIVDGRDRVNCIKQAHNCLTSKGVIILDDSQRPQYKSGIEFLLSNGFKNIEFEGLEPCGFSISKTTIFYKGNNCLGL